MKLVYKETQKEVKVGDVVKDFRGDEMEVTYFREPTSSSSEGKVSVKEPGSDDMSSEYYVGIIGAQWIEREDRGEGVDAIIEDTQDIQSQGRILRPNTKPVKVVEVDMAEIETRVAAHCRKLEVDDIIEGIDKEIVEDGISKHIKLSVGDTLPNGATVIAINYAENLVIGHQSHKAEEYVVWRLGQNNDTYNGHYFYSIYEAAMFYNGVINP